MKIPHHEQNPLEVCARYMPTHSLQTVLQAQRHEGKQRQTSVRSTPLVPMLSIFCTNTTITRAASPTNSTAQSYLYLLLDYFIHTHTRNVL